MVPVKLCQRPRPPSLQHPLFPNEAKVRDYLSWPGSRAATNSPSPGCCGVSTAPLVLMSSYVHSICPESKAPYPPVLGGPVRTSSCFLSVDLRLLHIALLPVPGSPIPPLGFPASLLFSPSGGVSRVVSDPIQLGPKGASAALPHPHSRIPGATSCSCHPTRLGFGSAGRGYR